LLKPFLYEPGSSLGNAREPQIQATRLIFFKFLSSAARTKGTLANRPIIVPLHNKYRLKATVLALRIGKVDIGKGNGGGEGESDYDALSDAYYHGI
jgi:hypothetical protein